MLRSQRFFRHQDWQNWLMSYMSYMNMDKMDNMDNMDNMAEEQEQHQIPEVVVLMFLVLILAAPILLLSWNIFTKKSLHTWFNISLGLAYLLSGMDCFFQSYHCYPVWRHQFFFLLPVNSIKSIIYQHTHINILTFCQGELLLEKHNFIINVFSINSIKISYNFKNYIRLDMFSSPWP